MASCSICDDSPDPRLDCSRCGYKGYNSRRKSKLPFTSVVSLHTNEYGCGVAKFSKQLAERLGVPFGALYGAWGAYPLLSLKWSEVEDERMYTWDKIRDREREGLSFGVFWHDDGDRAITDDARIVYYADPSLGAPGLWCPSLIEPPKPRTVKLFSFGMAHKLQTQHFQKVRELLDAASIRYHLRVSVGLHEGTSLSDATQHFDALKDIMGAENVTILGILSDDAVNQELQDADYVLAFFEQGVRANNTTVHAALSANKRVFTNHDAQTPGYLKAATRDIVTRDVWESSIPYYYSWDRLIEQMEVIYAATANRQPIHLGR